MKIMITGHRKLQNSKVVEEALNMVVDELGNDHVFISGGALGVDQIFIKIALEREIPFHVYVPYQNQAEYWTPFQQNKYFEFLNKAENIERISYNYYPEVYNDRNRKMVDACDIGIAVWDGRPSGTGNTVRMLKKANKLKYLLSLDTDGVTIEKTKKETLDGFF